MSTARPRVRPFADLLQLFVPPGIWFAQFITVYLAEALMCAPPIARPAAMIWIGAAATTIALTALIALALTLRRHADATNKTGASFSREVTGWLALLAGLAVIWTAFPLAVLPACAPPAG